ncbi:MAG: phage tail protein, partial [Desulfovibrio sp.]|uniref:phage tail protein n=1 Tax=Desulfovibrio sp. TaxID=885 RepID=UPI00258C4411
MQKFRAYPLIFWLFLLPLLAQPALGADATSFDPTRVEVKAKGSGGVPVGTIISWPVSQNPEDMDNWLECNGQSISWSVYPELFALLGGRTPDLRGL